MRGSNTAFCGPESALSGSQGCPAGAESVRDYKVLPEETTMDERAAETGAVTGGVKILLRLEGLTLFVGMVMLYAAWGGSWLVFALLFFVPDLSFLAYLADARFGATVYNAAHSYMAPVTLLTLGFGFASPLTLSIALIWLAHIGIDRALGYGLKYAAGFGFTHLGRIGRQTGA
jgi:Domain of unknown function (DUF4260)